MIKTMPTESESSTQPAAQFPVPQFTAAQVIASSTEYFGGDEMAATTFANKYALQTSLGGATPYCELNPNDMHDRIARELHRIESKYPNPRKYTEFRKALQGFEKIVPQGSPMYGIGNPYAIVSLSNCVVVESPEDNMSSIFESGKELANLYKRRAGVGLSLDTLRPENAPVSNAAKASTGAWSFAGFYSNVTRMVGQAGRRGALMLTMNMLHPDVHKFIGMKQDIGNVTGANVSVMLGDSFMNAATTPGAEWITRWSQDKNIQMTDEEVEELLALGGEWVYAEIKVPVLRDTDETHPVLNTWTWKSSHPDFPRLTSFRKFVAAELWEFLNRCARNTAEPGLLFWDNYGRELPANYYPGFKSTSTNPCSEIALSPYDSCRLTSLNLKGFVKNPFTQDAYFDFEEFAHYVRLGMRVMDNIVDLEIECLQNIINMIAEEDEKILWGKLLNAAQSGRRTGLGTHALGDALACLCLRYDSDEAIAQVNSIYNCLRDNAYRESVNLAKERGCFPVYNWETEKGCPFIQRLPNDITEEMKQFGRRNISLLTNAPTGSVSIVSRTSSGIEPTFRHFYVRRQKINPNDADARVDFKDASGDSWQHFDVFERNMQEFFEFNPDIKAQWDEIYHKSPHKEFSDNMQFWTDELNKILPDYFVYAEMIDPLQRVRLQGVLQSYIDHGVSSTINMNKDVTSDYVREIYEEAWRCGLKGVTVYRDKSRSGVLVTSADSQVPTGIIEHDAPKRPEILPCHIERATVEGEKWTIFVGLLDGKPYEIFGGLAENIEIPKKYTTGYIRKRKCEKRENTDETSKRKACYDLIAGDDDDPLIVKDVVINFNDDKYGWGTRMLSTMLRHGVPLRYIVEQLRRSYATSLHSFNKAMSRVLAKYDEADGTGEIEKPDNCRTGNCE